MGAGSQRLKSPVTGFSDILVGNWVGIGAARTPGGADMGCRCKGGFTHSATTLAPFTSFLTNK